MSISKGSASYFSPKDKLKTLLKDLAERDQKKKDPHHEQMETIFTIEYNKRNAGEALDGIKSAKERMKEEQERLQDQRDLLK